MIRTLSGKKAILRIEIFFVLLLVLMTALNIFFVWFGDLLPGHVSGAWANLASDFSNGIFYRPLYSPETGYGGTRFMPLFFVLLSLLGTITGNIISAGYILNIIVISGICIVVWLLIKAKHENRLLPLIITGCIFISMSVHYALADIRGDMLAVLLSVSGIYAFSCYTRKESLKYIITAIVFFILAFFTKLTSLHGIAAVVIYLLVNRQWKKSFITLFSFFALAVSGVIIINIASNGNFLTNMIFSATGGATFKYIIKAPFHILKVIFSSDIPVLLFLVLTAGIFLVNIDKSAKSLQRIYLLITFAVTVTIFGSPGINNNHLIDLHVASVIFTGTALATADRKTTQISFIQIFLILMISLYPSSGHIKWTYKMKRDKINNLDEIKKAVPAEKGDILSENPALPLLFNEPVYVQDTFMLRLNVLNDKSYADPLIEKLNKKSFRAVTLMGNADMNPEWYEKTHFGMLVINEIRKNYYLAEQCGLYFIYRPRNNKPSGIRKNLK